jgi:hypothetical protein
MENNIQFTNNQDNQVEPPDNMGQSNPQIVQSNSNSKSKNILIVTSAIIITAFLFGGGVFYWQQKNLKKTKISMQKEIDELTEKNSKMKDELNKSKSSAGEIDLFSARQKARKASIKSTMASASIVAILCEDEEKNILSGDGGGKVCDRKNNGNWPKIDICGPNDSDTKWIVKNGNSADWSFTLECKEFSDCNGPENAVCDSMGCKFSGSCQ